MSRRTAEASRAIRRAWDNERELVTTGMGTRDWTEDQQREILEGRCAHDGDGKAFEGHHMMNAEAHPELQGEPGNIQFLTRKEHLDAHGGSWRNQTSGYYDPSTGLTHPFENGVYHPCDPIVLSSPVAKIGEPQGLPNIENVLTANGESGSIDKQDGTCDANAVALNHDPPARSMKKSRKQWAGAVQKIRDVAGGAASSVIGFAKNHPEVVAVAATVVVGIVKQAVSDAVDNNPDGQQHAGGEVTSTGEEDEGICCDEGAILPGIESPAPDGGRAYPEERSFPRRHDVRGYDRTVNGKTVHVSGYTRGRDE